MLQAPLLLAQKPAYWDTTRYQKFQSNLIVGFFQSYRNFNNLISYQNKDSSHIDYFAESNLISGLEVTYDKFSLSVGVKSTPPDSRKGNTRLFNLGFNFGANRWFWENSFRSFRGFYDNRRPPDTLDESKGNYYQQPNLSNIVIKSRIMFFSNYRKFSFRAPYAFNYRQLKSAATWVASGNINYFRLSNDSALIPHDRRRFYDDQSGLTGLGSFGISLNAGAAATLVLWRALFLNIYFTVGPEHQWRTYHFPGRKLPLFYTAIAGDARGSFGLNFKHCYVVWTSYNDFVFFDSSFIKLQNKNLSGGFSFGWRFNSRTPTWYKKLQQSDFYKSI